MSAPQSAEDWQAGIDARIERLAQAQRDQRKRFTAAGACEVCGAPDAPTVVDFNAGGDGIRRLCEKDRKEAGLDVEPPRSAVVD